MALPSDSPSSTPTGPGADAVAAGAGPAGRAPLRVALLGYGTGGQIFHGPLLRAEPALRVTAVVTTGPGAAADAARRDFPDAARLYGAERVWERAAEYDLAVVTTPNRTHVPLATAALESGLAVVVDKPLAATSAEARQLAALAADRGRLLSVFHNRRWDGDFRTVRTLAARGELGRVLRLESRFERWRPRPKAGSWRETGGVEEVSGHLYDLGTHLIDQAIQLLGPVRTVYAELDARRPGVATDDDGFVALTHIGGARSHLWTTSLAAQAGPRLRVLGDRAAYVRYGLDGQEAALRAGRLPGGEGWGLEPPENWGLLGQDGKAEPVPTEAGDWPAFYRAVAAAVRGEGANPVPAESVVPVLEVLEAALTSARDHAVVTLS
jgi:predicted dehydrogenase